MTNKDFQESFKIQSTFHLNVRTFYQQRQARNVERNDPELLLTYKHHVNERPEA